MYLNIIPTITLVTLIVSIFVNIFFIFLIARVNLRNATHKIFVILSVVIIFWATVFYMSIQPNPPIFSSLFWVRLSIFFATPMTVLFFLLTHTFPDETFRLRRRWLILLSMTTVFVMGIVMSRLSFTRVEIINNFPSPVAGPGIGVFALFMIILDIAIIYTFYRKIKNTISSKRRPIWLFLIGLLAMHIPLITTILIPVSLKQQTTFVPLFPIYTSIFIGITAYAIIRHKLFNIKVIATQGLTLVIWIILLTQTLIEQTWSSRIITFTIFLFTLIFGIFLIKSVKREVEQRERIEKLAKELEIANERLKELDKLKTEFLSFASHQLRSPLTAIRGYTSMLLEGSYGVLEEKAREPINRVMESANHLVKLIEDFLNVTKIEQGGMKYEIAKTDIEHLARELARELSVSAEKKGLKLTFETDGKVGYYANADQEKLRQVLLNFIDNAIKYTPSGTVKVVVGKTPDRKVRVSVSDSGVGMTAEAIGKLFAKFSRADEKKVNINGSGLGLYLAKQIVEAHGGRIWAESPGPDLGSTFSIELAIIV